MVSFDSVTIGSVATYTCDRAYRLVGNNMRTCTRNGAVTVWAGEEPTCECKMIMHATELDFLSYTSFNF